jgi:transcriptional regulator with XRE-family HTH domain
MDVNMKNTIGQRIREERKRLGFTQADFAKAVGVHCNSQSNYENGKRYPDTAYLSAIGAVGVDVGYVTTGSRGAIGVPKKLTFHQVRGGDDNFAETLLYLMENSIEKQGLIVLSPEKKVKAFSLLLRLLDDEGYIADDIVDAVVALVGTNLDMDNLD